MQNKDCISVIVPVFNIENYIDKCIRSIVGQTYKNLQIILVDDGSTDSSGFICDKYASQDSRIEVIHKVNGGLSDARNHGIEIANGEFIAFVDGDDWIHSQMYELMMKQMIDREADMVTCWYEQKDEKQFSHHIDDKQVITKTIDGTEALCDIEIPLVVAWNKLYRRYIFDDLRYPVGRLHEDEFLIHRIFYKCKKIVVISNPLYFYTIRDGSIVHNMSPRRVYDALDAFDDRISFAYDNNWNEVKTSVITRYCDYCLNTYWGIKNGRYQIDSNIAENLWQLENKKCQEFLDVSIDRKYREFGVSPDVYLAYEKRVIRKKDMIRFLTYVPRKLKKIGRLLRSAK